MILGLAVKLHVAIREPVSGHEHIDVVVDGKVVAEVREVPRVVACGTNQIVQAEPGEQNSAPPAPPNIIENERQPHDRDIADVQDRRPRNHRALVDPFHLARCEVVVRHRLGIGRDVCGLGVHASGARIGREPLAFHVPGDAALLEVGQRIPHGPAAQAGVVAHAFPDEHGPLIE